MSERLVITDTTEKELLDAISGTFTNKLNSTDKGATTEEIMDRTGLSRYTVRRLLRKLVDSNVIEPLKSYRKAIDGVARPVPVYCLVEKGES